MRSTKGWLACLMALAVGIFVLGSPPKASADLVLALQEAGVNGGAITTVATVPSFNATGASFTGTYGDYQVTILAGFATNGAAESTLLSSTVNVSSLVAAPHTLNLLASENFYTLPTVPPGNPLRVSSNLGGTYGAEAGFTGAAMFQMWADSGNALLTIPGTFTNGLQPATPASGNNVSFDTGTATGLFTRGAGPYSLTSRATIPTVGLGHVNFSSTVSVRPVPEPGTAGTLLLMGLGFGGMFIGVRRRKS